MAEQRVLTVDSKERVAFDLMAFIVDRDIKGNAGLTTDTKKHVLTLYVDCLKATRELKPD